MSIIQRGNSFYFTSPPQFLTDQNSATPQPCDLSSWGVPADALSYRVQCAYFHGLVDQYGNIDLSLICRLPGYEGTAANNYTDAEDFGTFAGIYDSGMTPNALMGRAGMTLEIPNINCTFWWVPRGATTINCAKATLRLLSYLMP